MGDAHPPTRRKIGTMKTRTRQPYTIRFVTDPNPATQQIKTWLQFHTSEEACRTHATKALTYEYDWAEIVAIIQDDNLTEYGASTP